MLKSQRCFKPVVPEGEDIYVTIGEKQKTADNKSFTNTIYQKGKFTQIPMIVFTVVLTPVLNV